MEKVIGLLKSIKINKHIFILKKENINIYPIIFYFQKYLQYKVIYIDEIYEKIINIVFNIINNNFKLDLLSNESSYALMVKSVINKNIQHIVNKLNKTNYEEYNLTKSRKVNYDEKLCNIICNNKRVKTIVYNYVNNNITFGNLVIVGKDINEINASKYSIVLLQEENDSEKNIMKYMNKPIIICVHDIPFKIIFLFIIWELCSHYIDIILNNKQIFYIKRNEYNWINNYYLDSIKRWITKNIQNFNNYSNVNLLDLMCSVLLNISKYKPQKIFNLNKGNIKEIDKKLINREIINEDFKNLLNNSLNIGVIFNIVEYQIKRLSIFYSSNEVNKYINYMLNFNKIFNNTFQHRLVIRQNNIYDDITNNKIIIKEISFSEAEIYAKYFHYLHAFRKDTLISYGIFVEGFNEYPFGFVSFSRHDRQYKKDLISYFGIEPQCTLEMTRAWCYESAPKNSMSILFSQSFRLLQEKWKEISLPCCSDKQLRAITTTINPNLGFHASSFFGSNFIIFGLRPAKCTYFKGEYMPRRQIEQIVCKNIDKSDIRIIKGYSENSVYHLPLNEMICCFNKYDEALINNSDIIVINQKIYNDI